MQFDDMIKEMVEVIQEEVEETEEVEENKSGGPSFTWQDFVDFFAEIGYVLDEQPEDALDAMDMWDSWSGFIFTSNDVKYWLSWLDLKRDAVSIRIRNKHDWSVPIVISKTSMEYRDKVELCWAFNRVKKEAEISAAKAIAIAAAPTCDAPILSQGIGDSAVINLRVATECFDFSISNTNGSSLTLSLPVDKKLLQFFSVLLDDSGVWSNGPCYLNVFSTVRKSVDSSGKTVSVTSLDDLLLTGPESPNDDSKQIAVHWSSPDGPGEFWDTLVDISRYYQHLYDWADQFALDFDTTVEDALCVLSESRVDNRDESTSHDDHLLE
jgi:hypothetical protein